MIKEILVDLLIENPYYGYLASKVQFEATSSVDRFHWTFGRIPMLSYNHEWLQAQAYVIRKGLMIHELLHLALLHFMRRDGREEILWHMACDIAISELIDPEMVHEGILTVPLAMRETGLTLPYKATAEIYYDLLKGNESQQPYTYDDGEKSICFESGKVYFGEPLEQMNKEDMFVSAFMDELTSAHVAASNEDVLSDDLGKMTEEVYKDYKVNWRNTLKRFLSGQGRIQTRKSYKRQSRRFDDLPGSRRSLGIRALVAVDESGSVSNEEVVAFHKELLRINGINMARISALSFDTTCSEPVPLNQFITDMKRHRRGGTDFRPVFDVADLMKIPLVILFTDGQGQAPIEVKQKVLWVLTKDGKSPADYGTSIRFMEDMA